MASVPRLRYIQPCFNQQKMETHVAHDTLAFISTLCKYGKIREAIQAVESMKQKCLPFSSDLIYSVMKGCLREKDLFSARRICALINGTNLGSITFLSDNLIRLYATCGSLQEAYAVFLNVCKPTVYTWNSMISAFIQFAENKRALFLYDTMVSAGVVPDKVTFLSILKTCTSDVNLLKQMHQEIIEHGCDSDLSILNTILATYCKCSTLKDAENIFYGMECKDVVTWSAMISGYAEHGHGWLALNIFQKMQQVGIQPNILTFSSIMKACGSTGNINCSFYIHDEYIRSQVKSDAVIEGALIDMYAKCGNTKEARKLFDNIGNPDIVSYGAMMIGYVMQDQSIATIQLFEKMELSELKPNRAIYICLVKACDTVRALQQGRFVHDRIIKSGLESDISVVTMLIGMYIKCGSLGEAHRVFNKFTNPDAVTWAAMIAGYSSTHLSCESVQQCLSDMQHCGVEPVDASFTSVLNGCGHAGLIADGQRYFQMMREAHRISPTMEHFSCMIDIFGRTGQLQEAEALLWTIPGCPDAIVWRSFLACCKTHNNLEIGRQCFDKVRMLDPDDASGYVLMSSMYAELNMWEKVEQIEIMRKSAGVLKVPGICFIELGDAVHQFIVSGEMKPGNCSFHDKIFRVERLIKQHHGYVPHSVSLVLSNVTY